MARKPRIEYPGGLYHVIARGNQRRAIFHDDADRRAYLQRVERYKDRYGFLLFAYTLMTNHVHLLIEMQTAPLSKILQGLNQSYTQYYNRRYATVGHAFQGRYQSILCEREAYWLALVRYIHLNAVRAKLVADPAAYPWSSHRAYVGLEPSRFVDADLVLVQFAAQRSAARRKYAAFVQEDATRGKRLEYYQVRDQRFLGDEGFVEQFKGQSSHSSDKRASARRSLSGLLEAVAARSGVAGSRILGPERANNVVRARRLLVLACARCAIPGRDVANLLKRDPALISRMAKRNDPDHQEQVEQICRAMQSQQVNV